MPFGSQLGLAAGDRGRVVAAQADREVDAGGSVGRVGTGLEAEREAVARQLGGRRRVGREDRVDAESEALGEELERRLERPARHDHQCIADPGARACEGLIGWGHDRFGHRGRR